MASSLRVASSTLLVVVFLFGNSAPQGSPAYKTPLSIETIFVAKCLEYQQIVRPDLFINYTKNCTDLWNKFTGAFAYKNACSVFPEDYKSFIEEADHYINTQDRVMYWSGDVYPMVVEYSRYGNRYTIIRDQLVVYALDKIDNWCGQLTEPGINYWECPGWGDCKTSATSSFWTQMSKFFASKVKGTVHLMLNSSSPQPYRRGGIFSVSELANLNNLRTPRMVVHLVSPLDVVPKENCSTGTILELKEDVEKKGIQFNCIDKDPSIVFYQCSIKPGSKSCNPTCPPGNAVAISSPWSLIIALIIIIITINNNNNN